MSNLRSIAGLDGLNHMTDVDVASWCRQFLPGKVGGKQAKSSRLTGVLIAGLLVVMSLLVLQPAVVHAQNVTLPEISITDVRYGGQGDRLSGPEGTTFTFELTASSAPSVDLTVAVDVDVEGNYLNSSPTDPDSSGIPFYNGTPASAQVVFAAGTTTSRLRVATLNDTTDEPDGSIAVKLLAGTGYTLTTTGFKGRLVLVTDDEADLPTISVTDVRYSRQGDRTTGVEGRWFTFVFTADPAPSSALSVGVDVDVPENYLDRSPRGMNRNSAPFYNGTEASEVVTFAAGATTGKLRVATKNDRLNEVDGAMTMSVVAGSGYYVGTQSRRVVTITDDDDVTISIAAVRSTITEGGDAQFEITASGRSQKALVINFDIKDDHGSFIKGIAPISKTLPARHLTAIVNVPTSDDQLDEIDGRIRARLLDSELYIVSTTTNQATVVVSDNDASPEVTINRVTEESIVEGQIAEFELSLTNSSTLQPVLINIAETGNYLADGETQNTMKVMDPSTPRESFMVRTQDDGIDGESGTITVTATVLAANSEPPATSSAEVTVTDAPASSSNSGESNQEGNNNQAQGAVDTSITLPTGDIEVAEGEVLSLPLTISPAYSVNTEITMTFQVKSESWGGVGELPSEVDRLEGATIKSKGATTADALTKLPVDGNSRWYEAKITVPASATSHTVEIAVPNDNPSSPLSRSISNNNLSEPRSIVRVLVLSTDEDNFYIKDDDADSPEISFGTIPLAEKTVEEGDLIPVPITASIAPWQNTVIKFTVTTKNQTDNFFANDSEQSARLLAGDMTTTLRIQLMDDLAGERIDEAKSSITITVKTDEDADPAYRVATDENGNEVSVTYDVVDTATDVPEFELCKSVDKTVMEQDGGVFTYKLCSTMALAQSVDFKIDVKLGDLTDNPHMAPRNFFKAAQFETDSLNTINAQAASTSSPQSGVTSYEQNLSLQLKDDEIDQGLSIVIYLQLKADSTGQNYTIPEENDPISFTYQDNDEPTLRITTNFQNRSYTESSTTPINVGVRADKIRTKPITVHYRIDAGANFLDLENSNLQRDENNQVIGQIVFGPGSSSSGTSITLHLVNNDYDNADEPITITIIPNPNIAKAYDVHTTKQSTSVTIRDDETPTLMIRADGDQFEGTTTETMSFVVTSSIASTQNIQYWYYVSQGSADFLAESTIKPENDPSPLSGTLEPAPIINGIPVNNITSYIDLEILPDDEDEINGTITVTLLADRRPNNRAAVYELTTDGTKQATATVFDDVDDVSVISIAGKQDINGAMIFTEETHSSVIFTISGSLERANELPVLVTYEQTAGDFLADTPACKTKTADGINKPNTDNPCQIVTLPTGTGTKDFSIAISDDDLDKVDGEITATIVASSGIIATGQPNSVVSATQIAGYNISTTSPNASVTIRDNDDPPTIGFTTSEQTVQEGTTTIVEPSIMVNLSAVSGKTVTVEYSLTEGTAKLTHDYSLTAGDTGVLTFNAGETSKSIPVRIEPDSDDEIDETFTISLSNPSNATLGVASITETIVDDDVTEVSLDLSLNNGLAEGDSIRVRLNVNKAPQYDLPVYVKITDFHPTKTPRQISNPVVIPANQRSIEIPPVPTIVDSWSGLGVVSFKLFSSTEYDQARRYGIIRNWKNNEINSYDISGRNVQLQDLLDRTSPINNTTSYTVEVTARNLASCTLKVTASSWQSFVPIYYVGSDGTVYGTPIDLHLQGPRHIDSFILSNRTEFYTNYNGWAPYYRGRKTVGHRYQLSDTIRIGNNTAESEFNCENATLTTNSIPKISVYSERQCTIQSPSFHDPSEFCPIRLYSNKRLDQALTVNVDLVNVNNSFVEETQPFQVTIPAGSDSGDFELSSNQLYKSGYLEYAHLKLRGDSNAPNEPATYTVDPIYHTSVIYQETPNSPIKPIVWLETAQTVIREGEQFEISLHAYKFEDYWRDNYVSVHVSINNGSNSNFIASTSPSGLGYYLWANLEGNTYQFFTIDDDIYEPDGTVTITISPNSDNRIYKGKGSVTIVVTDNDTPSQQNDKVLAITSTTVSESIGTAELKVTLSSAPGLNKTILATWQTVDGSAISTANSDFTAISNGTITFTDDETEKPIEISIENDSLDEDPEQFEVVITTTATGITTHAGGKGRITIIDNDIKPTLSIVDAEGNEGNANNHGSVEFTPRLNTVSGRDVVIAYSTSTGSDAFSATTSDFTAANNLTITIPAGQRTPINENGSVQTISIETKADSVGEPDETFILTYSSPNALVPDTTATGKILNDDERRIVITDISVNEHAGTAELEVIITPAPNIPVTVPFSVSTNSAGSSDYTVSNLTPTAPQQYRLQFGANEKTKQIRFNIEDDNLEENDEMITVTLTKPGDIEFYNNDDSGTVTIVDNDEVRYVYFFTPHEPVFEHEGIVELEVKIYPAPSIPVDVHFAVSNTTPISGLTTTAVNSDYTLSSSTSSPLQFGANEDKKKIKFNIVDDSLAEDSEWIVVTLSKPDNIKFYTSNTIGEDIGLITIIDNDDSEAGTSGASSPLLSSAQESTLDEEILPEISISNVIDSIIEGEVARFEIQSNIEFYGNRVINLDIKTSGGNFIEVTGPRQLVLDSGQTTTLFEIQTVDDTIDEPDGQIEVHILSGDGYEVAEDQSQAVIQVFDNDDRRDEFRALIAEMNRNIIPDILRTNSGKIQTTVSDRVAFALNSGNQSTFTLGGQSTLQDIIQQGGEYTNQDDFSWYSVLDDTAFSIGLFPEASGYSPVSIWGIGDFHDVSKTLTDRSNWGGDLFTGQFGIDARFNPEIVIGVSAAFTESDIDYHQRELESESQHLMQMTTLNPYYGWMSSDQKTKFNVFGSYGSGNITVDHEEFDTETTTSQLFMTSIGGSNELYSIDHASGMGSSNIKLQGDAFLARQYIDDNDSLIEAMEIYVHQFRMAFIGSQQYDFANGSQLKPSLSVGLRQDGGDGDTWAGSEVFSGLDYDHSSIWSISGEGGIQIGWNDWQRDWGLRGSFAYDVDNDERGLLLSISPYIGQSRDSNLGSFWRNNVSSLSENDQNESTPKWNTEFGYGFDVWDQTGVLTPYTGIDYSGVGQYDLRIGNRVKFGSHFSFKVEGIHNQNLDQSPVNKINLNAKTNW